MTVKFVYTCGHVVTWEREDVDPDIAGECPDVVEVRLPCLDCTVEVDNLETPGILRQLTRELRGEKC